MTQISDAKKGILTEEMKHVAKIEGVSEDFILSSVADGTIVIPSNVNRDIEASGIGIACIVAQYFDCPVLFAKKSKTKNIASTVYKTQVESFTHGKTYDVIVSKDFIGEGDKVLIVDDFLAEGNALLGLIDLCKQAGAEVAGCAIAVEKAFQQGGKKVRALGVKVESLAMVESMSDNSLTFVK